MFFLRIDDGHCDRIHSSLTVVHCLNKWLCGKAARGLERILYKVLVKGLQESMDRCTCRYISHITEILLKMALNTIQSIDNNRKKKMDLKNQAKCHIQNLGLSSMILSMHCSWENRLANRRFLWIFIWSGRTQIGNWKIDNIVILASGEDSLNVPFLIFLKLTLLKNHEVVNKFGSCRPWLENYQCSQPR